LEMLLQDWLEVQASRNGEMSPVFQKSATYPIFHKVWHRDKAQIPRKDQSWRRLRIMNGVWIHWKVYLHRRVKISQTLNFAWKTVISETMQYYQRPKMPNGLLVSRRAVISRKAHFSRRDWLDKTYIFLTDSKCDKKANRHETWECDNNFDLYEVEKFHTERVWFKYSRICSKFSSAREREVFQFHDYR
jgi:hypothetical protein